MEDNHQLDPLAQYFRQTLHTHEAEPPADLWERVEADLPQPRQASLRQGWIAAAILLLVALSLALLVIRYLPQGTPPAEAVSAVVALPEQSHPSTLAREEPECSTAPNEDAPSRKACRPADRLLPTTSLHRRPPRSREFSAFETASPPYASFYSKEVSSESPPSESSGDMAEEEKGWRSAIPRLTTITPVPVRQGRNEMPTFPGGESLSLVRPMRPFSGWSIGVCLFYRYEPLVPPQTPITGTLLRPVFVGRPQDVRPVPALGVRISKQMSGRWSVALGALYSETTRTTQHIGRFRFGEGRPLPGGGPGHSWRREFSYQLNTYAGSATVDFRMEPTGSLDPSPQTEPVVVRALAMEYAQVLKVPLVVSYTVGSGRLRGVLRAGVAADLLLKSDFRLTSLSSENARLRLMAGSNPTIRWVSARPLSMGYWVSAAAAYRCHRHLELSIEPVLTGLFSRRDNQGNALPTPAAVGVQGTLSYRW